MECTGVIFTPEFCTLLVSKIERLSLFGCHALGYAAFGNILRAVVEGGTLADLDVSDCGLENSNSTGSINSSARMCGIGRSLKVLNLSGNKIGRLVLGLITRARR